MLDRSTIAIKIFLFFVEILVSYAGACLNTTEFNYKLIVSSLLCSTNPFLVTKFVKLAVRHTHNVYIIGQYQLAASLRFVLPISSKLLFFDSKRYKKQLVHLPIIIVICVR